MPAQGPSRRRSFGRRPGQYWRFGNMPAQGPSRRRSFGRRPGQCTRAQPGHFFVTKWPGGHRCAP